mgnify:CR=1 FL=1
MVKNDESVGRRKTNEVSTDATSLMHLMGSDLGIMYFIGSDEPSWANQMVENSEIWNLEKYLQHFPAQSITQKMMLHFSCIGGFGT